MATFTELLEDRKQYPDETKVNVHGVEVSLGELRSGYMKDSDYRRKGQKLADERRSFEQERVAFEQERLSTEQHLKDLAAVVLRGNPGASQQEVEDELDQNPVARKLQDRLGKLEESLKTLGSKLESTEGALAKAREERIVEQHQRVLGVLKAHDPNLDTEELIEYCKREHVPRLDHGYRLMTEEKRAKAAAEKAKEEGFKAGVEKGKSEATQVNIPKSRLITSLLPEKAPKTFDEAAVAAEQDPEIVNLLGDQG